MNYFALIVVLAIGCICIYLLLPTSITDEQLVKIPDTLKPVIKKNTIQKIIIQKNNIQLSTDELLTVQPHIEDFKKYEMEMKNPALVVIAHNRHKSLRECLKSIISQSFIDEFQVYVSLDDSRSYKKMRRVVLPLQHQINIKIWENDSNEQRSIPPLAKIARHFKIAMDKAFMENKHSHLILMEDDLRAAPDFIYYFRTTAWLLDADPTLFCISAWNDNGHKSLVHDKRRLFRSDYFSGLGWMLRRELWLELRDKWPINAATGWDHWLRLSVNSKGRECIVPEISRTKHCDSKNGVNVQNGGRFKDYSLSSLMPPRSRSHKIKQSSYGDVSVLLNSIYEPYFQDLVEYAQRIEHVSEIRPPQKKSTLQDYFPAHSSAPSLSVPKRLFLIPYSIENYRELKKTQVFALWEEPRATHKGVIIIRHQKYRETLILLAMRRFCPYLNLQERILPTIHSVVVAAEPGISCEDACRFHDNDLDPTTYRCSPDDLPFINQCEQLSKIFSCKAGCGHQVGGELPAFVVSRDEITYGQCLITVVPHVDCGANHPSTRRACPCVPII